MLARLKKFARDTRGNTLMLFGLSIVPLVGVAGMAMDYSRSVATKTALQNAIDATGLMLAGDIKRTPTQLDTDAKRTARALSYFTSQFAGRHATNAVVTTTYTPGTLLNGGRFGLNVSATADVPTMLSRVFGPEKLVVGTTSDITWGLRRLELALALDNTGSMASSNKMVELKTSTRNLLDTLYKSALKAGDVKVAIVPFAEEVNVGAANINANFLDWTKWDSEANCTQWSGYSCTKTSGAKKARSTWSGCVWDRAQNYDVNDTAPTTSVTNSLFQPKEPIYAGDSSCPVQMLPLTDIFTNNAWNTLDRTNTLLPLSTLGQKVNSMTPEGGTNVTIGMVWAWHMLTNSEPMTQAEAPAKDLDKVIILLTDGLNTKNRFNGNGSDPCPQCVLRTAAACANAKAAGIIIYTIRVIDGDTDMLQACATNPSMFYNVSSAADLNSVFGTIAQNLSSLRIAK